MERTFKQELELAMEHKINVLKLTIANEVCSMLEGNWWFESYLESNDQATNELFERICERVQDVYLKVDNTYSLSNIVEAIIRLHTESKIEIKDINKYMVIEYIQDNF
jgi:hypothetical protein